MWRSNLIIRYSRQALPLIRNQVCRFQASHFSLSHSQNPRFFSNDAIPRFDENPSFSSQEPEPLFADFDKTANFISDESETSFTNFDENPDFTSQDDQNPSLVSEENAENDEQMGCFEAEETPVVIDIEKVESVLSVLQSSNVDESMESNFDKMDLDLNVEFMVRVIETPLVPGDNLIRFFKWACQRSEACKTTRVVGCLVTAVAIGLKKKEAYALWDLVKEIGEKEKHLLNTEILNELISLFWKLGKGKAGLEVFNKFEIFGCEPNPDSYYLTIEALCSRSIFDWAWPVCEKMLNVGNLPDSKKVGSIITCFCKGKKAKEAHLVYLMAKEKKKLPPRTYASFLVSSLSKEDDTVKLALDVLNNFPGDARKYAIKPFTCVVHALCRIKDFKGAKKLLSEMIDEGPPPGTTVFNLIINGLSKEGEMDEVIRLVKVMENRGLRPDVYTYSVIISGFVKGGEMDEARKILSEAKKKHSKLCPVMFHTLTRGYCKLEEFDKAVELLKEMKECGVQPNADECTKMIKTLCLKALDWKTAEKLAEEMKENGLYLNEHMTGLIKSVKELEEQELGEDVVSIEA